MKRIIQKLPLEERLFWAKAPFTPEEFLHVLAGDKNDEVREAVARNPSASPETLKRLARSSKPYVRLGVAMNPSTPPEILERLAEDWADSVRQAVAENPRTPPSILTALSMDPDGGVREQVVANKNTPKEVLLLLLVQERRLLPQLMENPNILPKLLTQLLGTGEIDLNKILPLLTRTGEQKRIRIAQSPICPPELLFYLAKDKSEYVRGAVAKNPSCPKDILRHLAQDPEPHVRLGVAENPSTEEDLLRLLAKDPIPLVRGGVARNPSCPKDLSAKLALDRDEIVRHTAWYEAPNRSLEGVLTLILQHFGVNGTLSQPEAYKLLPFLDSLPQDPKLWLAIWKALDKRGRELFRTHPFGAQIALLGALGK